MTNSSQRLPSDSESSKASSPDFTSSAAKDRPPQDPIALDHSFHGEATQMSISVRMPHGEASLGIRDLIDDYRANGRPTPEQRAQGQHDPLDELLSLAYGRLERIARGRIRSGGGLRAFEQTVDLLQEAWITRIEKALGPDRPPIQDTAHFFALSAQLIRQTLIDMRRRTFKKTGLGNMQLRGDDTQGRNALDQHEESVEDSIWRRQADIAEAMSQLKPADEQILDLMVIHGVSRDDAADILGLTVHEVRKRLVKAKTRLGKLLQGYNNETASDGESTENL